jgi:hypothetical protein
MFDYSTKELATIDSDLEPKLAWAQKRSAEMEQLAMDATKLLSCNESRLKTYVKQPFFKRCWFTLCGKHGEIQRANERDIVEMQKYGFRYINLLQERSLLQADSLITVKNNLMTLAVDQEDIRNEITRMADKVYNRFVEMENRIKDLEVATKIHSWLLTIDTYEYDEKFLPNFRLLKVVKDFFKIKSGSWNINEIKILQQATKSVSLPWKEQISLSTFIDNLVDEIAVLTFPLYQDMLFAPQNWSNDNVPVSFIIENISVPSFISLYEVGSKYKDSSTAIDVLKEQLNIDKSAAIKMVMANFIKNQGIDLNISIPLRDLAVELLTCMKLTKDLFNKSKVEEPEKETQQGKNRASFIRTDTAKVSDENDFQQLLKQAVEGDVNAMNEVGECYFHGKKVKKNESEAMEWYKKSAEAGNSDAMVSVGKGYFSGSGVQKNQIEALNWYQRASNAGSSYGMFLVGDCHLLGWGTDKNDSEALKWYKKAADFGNGNGMCGIGHCYLNGWGVEENNVEALKWFKRGADAGNAEAIFKIGDFYFDGEVVEKDLKEAFKWYKKAAYAGEPNGMFSLGQCYLFGHGIEENNIKAIKWHKKAVDSGCHDSMFWLGQCYLNGWGVEENSVEALKYYKKAADAGNSEGMLLIGNCYLNGLGVDENDLEALEWYKKAADAGNSDGMFGVGQCYLYGWGVEKNIVQALKWYQKAADAGNSNAMLRLAEYYFSEENLDSARIFLEQAMDANNLSAIAVYAFITEGFHSDYDPDGVIGSLIVQGSSDNENKLKNARNSYAGDSADNFLVLWDDTVLGSAKEGFLITNDLQIVSHKDKLPQSLLSSPKSVLNKMKFFENKDKLKAAIIKLVQLFKKYNNPDAHS